MVKKVENTVYTNSAFKMEKGSEICAGRSSPRLVQPNSALNFIEIIFSTS